MLIARPAKIAAIELALKADAELETVEPLSLTDERKEA